MDFTKKAGLNTLLYTDFKNTVNLLKISASQGIIEQ